MLKLDGIAAFVAIAEAGSISAAGRRLHLSKSVVSERLAELEHRLGAPLFQRSTRRLSLTEDGAAFLEQASRIVREVDEAAAEIAARRGELRGPLRISAPVTFGRTHLGPALYPFLARHPGIALTLELDDRRVDAAADGFDAVIRHGALEDSRLVAWTLATSRRLLVATPTYLRRHGRPKSVEDLAEHRAIYYLNRGAAEWRFDAGAGNVVARPAMALRVNNGDMMRDALLAGLGLALLPTFIVGQDIKDRKLKVLDIGASVATEHLYVAHPDGRRASAKLRALVDALRGSFGAPPYWEVG